MNHSNNWFGTKVVLVFVYALLLSNNAVLSAAARPEPAKPRPHGAAAAPASSESLDTPDTGDDQSRVITITDTSSDEKSSISIPLSWLNHSTVIKAMREDKELTDKDLGSLIFNTLAIKIEPKDTLSTLKTIMHIAYAPTEKEPMLRNTLVAAANQLPPELSEATVIAVMKCAHKLALPAVMTICAQWFIKNRKLLQNEGYSKKIHSWLAHKDKNVSEYFTGYYPADLPADIIMFCTREAIMTLNLPFPSISLKMLIEHGVIPSDLFTDTDFIHATIADQIESLWKKIITHPDRNQILSSIPSSPLKDGIIEQLFNAEGENLTFLDWYEQLTPGRDDAKPENSVRSRVINIMQAKAKAFVGDAKDADTAPIIARFITLPEGYFKMLIRQQYKALHGNAIPESADGTIYSMEINGIITCINDYGSTVPLRGIGLGTLVGIDSLLVVKNEIEPIITLNLSYNPLTEAEIPKALTALRYLEIQRTGRLTRITLPGTLTALKVLTLNNNQLTTITIPTMPALEWLDISDNALSYAQKEDLRNRYSHLGKALKLETN